jgi:gliding motility-associated-like protein
MNVGQDDALQATILSAAVPCNSTSYTAIGNCVSNGNAPFSLNAAALPANTLYYIVVSGDLSGAGITSAAECDFDLIISGSGIDRPVSSVSLTTSPIVICKNDIFSANAILTNCPDTSSFNWYVNGVLTAVTTDAYFQSTALNNGDIVSLETNCYTLCAEMVTATTAAITVYSFPIDAGPDQLLNTGETTQLNGLTTAPVYSWSPTFGISDPSTLTPLVYPTSTTTYTLTATENGCTLEDYVTITIEEKLIFPTTFSPNDDGINDRWEIGGVSQYPNCFVKIYNRWGQEIFQSIGYSLVKSWDGTGNTGKLSEGVYFYIVELRDDKKQEFKGSITLIR